jgi:hypothetical protein
MPRNKSTAPRWAHQAKEFQIGREKRSRAYIWPMRSGKSRAVIDVGCYQFKRKKIEGVIVVAPNGVHLNWQRNEIPTWCSLDFANPTFAWETPKRGFPEKEREWEEFLDAPGLRWLCINMEALAHPDCMRAVIRFKKSCHNNFMFAISEAHHFGRAGSKRTHKARSLSYHAAYVRTETGTPILTGPLHAFSQYEILAPGALGFGRYRPFKDHYADMEPYGPPGPRQRERVVQYKNMPELTARIAPWTSLVMRSELGDMPELIRTERPVVMSEKQRRAYIQMVAQHLAEVEDVEVAVKDAGPRMMKLQQILNGYVMDTKAGVILTVDEDAPIYDAVIDEIKGTFPGRALVWCRYKEDCRRLARKLRQRKMGVLEYWGDFSTTAREANRAEFLAGADATMIGTPDCGGEGLDFSAADAVIFMSGNPNARMMAQAEERATVKGGKSVSVVRIRNYGTVDDRIYNIIDDRIKMADTVTGSGLRKMLLETDI